jgi:hypothetical protein
VKDAINELINGSIKNARVETINAILRELLINDLGICEKDRQLLATFLSEMAANLYKEKE